MADQLEFVNDFEGMPTLLAGEVALTLGISKDEFADRNRFSAFQDVVQFLSKEPNWRFLLTKVTIGKPGYDRLSLMQEYVDRRRQLEAARQQRALASDAVDRLRIQGFVDPEAQSNLDAAEQAVQALEAECRIYEK